MKTNKMIAAGLLALGLISCKNEPAKEATHQKMDYPVAVSLEGVKGALRAEQKSTSLAASYPNERAVENLTVVVFTNNGANNTPGSVEKVISYDQLTMPAGADPYNGTIKFDMGMAGTYQMEVIANGYKEASEKDAFIGKFPVGMSYAAFKKVVIERALPGHGETGFVMLGTEPLKVTTEQGRTAQAGTVKLRRLACRFDVFNKLPDELTLTKVTLRNQTVKSHLLPELVLPADADGGAKEYTPSGDWFTGSLVSGGIYSYENLENSVTLLVEGTFKGSPWQKVIKLKKGNGEIVTERNHLYRIYLTKGNGTTPGGGDEDKDNISYNIEVLDWNEDATLDYTDDDLWAAEEKQGNEEEQIKQYNPLAYVTEYNLAPNGSDFVKDLYATNVSGYFHPDTAPTQFKMMKKDDDFYYYLPSLGNWLSIFPEKNLDLSLGREYKIENQTMIFQAEMRFAPFKYKCDILSRGDGIAYAILFKDVLVYRTAYRYEIMKENGYQCLRVTSRNISQKVTIEDISKETFWQRNTASYVVRVFPFSGYRNHKELTLPSTTIKEGAVGLFLSASRYEQYQGKPWYTIVVYKGVPGKGGADKGAVGVDGGDYSRMFGGSVRLFRIPKDDGLVEAKTESIHGY